MTDKLTTQHHTTFESIRQTDEAGNEFLSTRDLAPLLDCRDWRNFVKVMAKPAWLVTNPENLPRTNSVTSPKWSLSGLTRTCVV